MINCNNCDKELNRCVFCSDKCRKQYVRKADKDSVIITNPVRKADKYGHSVRKADNNTEPRHPRKWNCRHGKTEGNCSFKCKRPSK